MEYVLVAWWLLAFLALAALAAPLTARVFRAFPGAGLGFAPTVALLVLVLVGYWAGRIGFGRPTLWLALLVLAALSAVFGLDRTALRRREIRLAPDVGPVNRRSVWAAAVVFVGAFLLVVAIRAADPAVNAIGGEKFLDYGLLRATLRADVVPVYDFWFAGESLNYYYGGHLAAALVTMLTGTAPEYAYNLALAGFYGCLAAAAFELARGIAAGRAADRGADAARSHEHGFRAGVAAVFVVALAGNAVTAVQVVAGVLPGGAGDRFAEAVAAGRVSAADLRAGADGFFYWDASRVIDGTITEFPLFAFLNGDLHAHMMGLPFLLLAAGVAYAYWRTPGAERRRRRVLVFGVVPLIGGMQVVIHTWDVPTTIGILWLALAFAPATPLSLLPRGSAVAAAVRDRVRSPTVATEIERTGGALVVAAVAGGLAFLIGAPFLLAASTGQEPTLLDAADRSGLGELLLVHVLFLAGFLAYLVGRLGADDDGGGDRGVVAVGIAAVVAVAVLSGFPAVAVVVPLLALGWAALRLGRDVGFETALLVGGAGLVGIVELVYVVEAAGPGRLNTVFKVYSQVWAVWGVALGVVLAELWAGGFGGVGKFGESGGVGGREGTAPAGTAPTGADPASGIGSVPVARLFVVAIVLLAAPYAGLALADHFDRHDAGTLDATAFAAAEHPAEAAAIDWLDATATHEDTLLEAPGASRSPEGLAAEPTTPGMYDWRANPASTLTGIPTVAGWAHQVGYRGEEAYYGRVADVDRAYAGDADERAAVLDAYDVDYVWVGPTERARYGAVDFDDAGEVVFENDTVRVYRIDGE
ncbi:hypothetical protein GRS48_09950 [Halorubrum sp. JWXQ-INN 858]|uniref:DUF2298 domain-containing protein n=1 Tax=Halorubrum sp. JWXQ-INN 858 TaxID=2690782 RepID=UPI0013581D4E|nr:DUF2298 domain-containing protein [Halorubrum sp. JWXQ-INN 858]MWV65139.1 hypothetical protein [Halorubrum sp. JWXQ-INN 858]